MRARSKTLIVGALIVVALCIGAAILWFRDRASEVSAPPPPAVQYPQSVPAPPPSVDAHSRPTPPPKLKTY